MSHLDVMSKLGLPSSWLGKPPCFGLVVLNPSEATTWFYYGGAVGIEFDQTRVTVRINLLPEKMQPQAPFGAWPIGPGMTLTDFRDFLVQNHVPFYEELDPNYPNYLVAGKNCVVQGSYYKNGKRLSQGERLMTMISTVANDLLLPDFVRGKRQSEWSLLSTFFSTHFPENWRRNGGNPDEVLLAYVRQTNSTNLRALRLAISNYLQRFSSDAELERKLLSELGCWYDPTSAGTTARNWLESITRRLQVGARNCQ